ncbi:hypothetical protein DACRYDRAFT_110889 [Dacryopinax primogenitus]|uniref:Uncharacterized protein n=1 Tax=Dacryopinax primogenitus (strain DJM 731) TaxID=1858805 RepID=M5FY12_DACPD|nr:uncharacterized protein DACRYDRAFT_110889 [Dacryopinax primogenitus]EJT98446.1 hypothetical protein DACRYDRAFT_110889 [Dacryopinax primogenitus]
MSQTGDHPGISGNQNISSLTSIAPHTSTPAGSKCQVAVYPDLWCPAKKTKTDPINLTVDDDMVTVKAEPVEFKNPFIKSQTSYKELEACLTQAEDDSITKTSLILILNCELKALKKENSKLKDALKAEKGGEGSR